jgi:hypothetical protein
MRGFGDSTQAIFYSFEPPLKTLWISDDPGGLRGGSDDLSTLWREDEGRGLPYKNCRR